MVKVCYMDNAHGQISSINMGWREYIYMLNCVYPYQHHFFENIQPSPIYFYPWCICFSSIG